MTALRLNAPLQKRYPCNSRLASRRWLSPRRTSRQPTKLERWRSILDSFRQPYPSHNASPSRLPSFQGGKLSGDWLAAHARPANHCQAIHTILRRPTLMARSNSEVAASPRLSQHSFPFFRGNRPPLGHSNQLPSEASAGENPRSLLFRGACSTALRFLRPYVPAQPGPALSLPPSSPPRPSFEGAFSECLGMPSRTIFRFSPPPFEETVSLTRMSRARAPKAKYPAASTASESWARREAKPRPRWRSPYETRPLAFTQKKKLKQSIVERNRTSVSKAPRPSRCPHRQESVRESGGNATPHRGSEIRHPERGRLLTAR
jgi:hypothetical protein